MPLPLAALAVPAMVEAAQFTAGVIATTIGVAAVHDAIKESDKEEEAEKEATVADSSKSCEECPAIPRVMPEEELFNGEKINLMYQARICSTGVREDTNSRSFIQEFAFRDPRLFNSAKKVKFDGWKPERCLFLEAKGRYDQFFSKDGMPWFSGNESIYNQAFRQQNAIDLCNNIPQCHWHFMQPVSFKYYSDELVIFKNITAFHTP
ncbi:Tox-REase-5 domain-containing protein [Pectobacterium brasiliense]|uniref:Tox-REase-5 domain-containing protein n=1 Tax=Pectobacterium brasiliense TaxID=180957 RepID=UPI00227CCE08|nr:Tox-REase-5 domain-containing protein [Pectobacterium brasiliense]WGL28670.1 Tox-REase-5 domain-containing protein [Pectobacterium brasiliense]